jgi:P2 family phage contractile tail tube protein
MSVSKILKNFNIYVDGIGYAGKASSVQLPELTIQSESHRAAGMDAPISLDMGMEELESQINFSSFEKALIKRFGLAEGNETQITAKGALRDLDGTVTAVTVSMRGTVSSLPLGTWEAGSKAELQMTLKLRYFKLQHGDEITHEIDPINNIRIVGGVDQLAEIRKAIGQE